MSCILGGTSGSDKCTTKNTEISGIGLFPVGKALFNEASKTALYAKLNDKTEWDALINAADGERLLVINGVGNINVDNPEPTTEELGLGDVIKIRNNTATQNFELHPKVYGLSSNAIISKFDGANADVVEFDGQNNLALGKIIQEADESWSFYGFSTNEIWANGRTMPDGSTSSKIQIGYKYKKHRDYNNFLGIGIVNSFDVNDLQGLKPVEVEYISSTGTEVEVYVLGGWGGLTDFGILDSVGAEVAITGAVESTVNVGGLDYLKYTLSATLAAGTYTVAFKTQPDATTDTGYEGVNSQSFTIV